jgi:hypothetical protein
LPNILKTQLKNLRKLSIASRSGRRGQLDQVARKAAPEERHQERAMTNRATILNDTLALLRTACLTPKIKQGGKHLQVRFKSQFGKSCLIIISRGGRAPINAPSTGTARRCAGCYALTQGGGRRENHRRR